ncbi:MAG: peroxiredoxin [Planctomycetaceae bacterium]|nr:peroxiredoxin [Planctomycetota bacterium]NUN52496.1 peroxiredoxin [Planctomycetaceae bacterium]
MSDAAAAAAKPSLPTIGSRAPSIDAASTHGPLSLDAYEGKWVILFSHPYDFTPVCSTEFLGFARRAAEFEERQAQLVGLSIDSVFSHISWVRTLEAQHGVKIPFPVIADLDRKVASAYGMVHPSENDMAPVRALFFIDPKRIVRACIYYPMTCGRNIDEVLRLLDALRSVDANAGTACPADWRPGDEIILPPPKTAAEAERRVAENRDNPGAKDWFFVKRKP